MSDEVTLTDLAALDALGLLDDAGSESLETLLSLTGASEAAVEMREATRVIAESLAPVPPPPRLREELLSTIRALPSRDATSAVPGETVRSAEGRWKTIATGIAAKRLARSRARGTITLLLRMDAGTRLPAHDHHGAEDTFVLRGSCRLGSVSLSMGDFHHVEAGTRHEDVTTDEGCELLLVVDEKDYRAA